ncbi:hypothetical protein ACFL0D_08695 [Thermoproteota archaeon]
MSASKNTIKLRELFKEISSQVNLRGILGVTPYKQVYESLLETQKARLVEITSVQHDEFMEQGNFISFAYVYPDGVIDNIGLIKEGIFDKESWNIYAKWYAYMNDSLDITSTKIADNLNGVPIKATSSGMALQVDSVSQYFPLVVSHRVHAELSDIGWRGKNSLIVNPIYSCMIRLAGLVSIVSLHKTKKRVEGCGACDSCFEVCTFLKYQEKLDDYREQCLLYMNSLDLDEEVCGKCVKACAYSPKFVSPKKLPSEYEMNDLFYTLP